MRSNNMLSFKKLSLLVLVLIVFPGAVAYAGFFSFFGEIFTKVNLEKKNINSQNIVLLASAAGPDVTTRVAPNNVNIVAQSALMADVGPVGGPADFLDEDYDHGQISIYVVREGDSFSAIAEMFGVSINTILWANNLPRGATLQVGQTLVILPVTGVQYVVKRGDTISTIAKKYRGDADEILSFNGLDDKAILSVGLVLIIPDGEIASTPIITRPASTKLRNASGPSYDGYYRAPFLNYRKSQGLHGYNGVDLVSLDGPGAYVIAAASGDVIISKSGCVSRSCNGGYGNYVVIKHGNGTQTLYGHLQGTAVRAGDRVAQGQLIGYEGNTGRSTGTHLHFEIRGARNPF